VSKPSKPTTLVEIYQAEIKKRGFKSDKAQLAALAPLERLRQELIAAQHSSIPLKLLRKLSSATPPPAPKGVYLVGGVGRGKTWLMDLFFAALPFAAKRRTHFYRFMQEIHARLAELKKIESPLDRVANQIADETRVICFDELFVADIGDAMILANVFDALLVRGVALVFTSNVAPKDLYKGGLQRQRFLPAIKLLESRTEVVTVDGGTDYRLQSLRDTELYVASSDANANAALLAIFEDLSDEDADTAGSIDLLGRTVAVIRESENVVWFDFAALCEGPRSAADYIHIAREYQAVLISDVPVFDTTREDAARRFVSLVDEFYDRGVILIVSASAPPNELYKGEKLRFEFERTASRLLEMQSQPYLARQHVTS
jgi:cell division protein ZapE